MSGPTPRERDEESSRDGERFTDYALCNGYYVRTEYDYKLPDGTLLYQTCRYDPAAGKTANKKFLRRRPDPNYKEEFPHLARENDKWLFGTGDRLAIYNWPAIVKADPKLPVFVTEGEKNAEDLIKLSHLATTVASHKWTLECAGALAGRELFILEDNDESGRKNAVQAYKELSKVAGSVRIVTAAHLWKFLTATPDPPPPRKPGMDPVRPVDPNNPPSGSDISDWLACKGDPKQLVKICRKVPAEGVINFASHSFPDEKSLPPYEWLYGRHLLRGEVSMTCASGGTGKSALSIVEALAQASGRDLLGINVPKPIRVGVINLEDDSNTMNKRVAAAMKYYKLKPSDIGGRLFMLGKEEVVVRIAKSEHFAVQIVEPQVQGLINIIRERKIDIISIDLFVLTHGVNENDNSAIRDVVKAYDRVAFEAQCSVHLWHHNRKANGAETSTDSVRGASSFVDACRSVRMLERMSAEEALKHDIKLPNEHFREFSGKRNFAPPEGEGFWYKTESVELDNGGPLFGDEIVVVTPWIHPNKNAANDLSPGTINMIKAAVTEGQWRDSIQAAMWVGRAIAPIIENDNKAVLKTIIDRLMRSGDLKRVRGKDKNSDDRWFVVVGEGARNAEATAPTPKPNGHDTGERANSDELSRTSEGAGRSKGTEL
jgi:hypothetical protein